MEGFPDARGFEVCHQVRLVFLSPTVPTVDSHDRTRIGFAMLGLLHDNDDNMGSSALQTCK